jgi:TP901 family phage tail tape measure protein
MADRVTKVTLTAQVSQYIAGMQQAQAATRGTATEAEKLTAQNEKFQALGRSAVAFGTLAAVGVGLAVSRFAEFDKAMSSVQAATLASTAEMDKLREAALQAGADTAFTAGEAAAGIEELAKAGVETTDVLNGGLTGALNLAAAGNVSVAEAAESAASAMTQFNLAGSDVPKVADLLAAAAGKAQGSVSDISAALGQAGLVASQMGLSLEETVGSLAAFASAGLTGSDAGTSFRAALLRLANPTDEAKEAMKELGIESYNAAGQFVGIESLAGQLQTKLGGLTQAQRNQTLALVFGQDAIRVANVLYKQGAEGIAEWTEKVDDSGYAAEVAETRLDNLAGDIEKLGGAFDTALIKTGSAANDVLRGIVQTVEGSVDAFARAPQAVQTVTLVVGALASAIGLAGGGFLLAIPKIVAFKAALATMSPATQKAAGALGALGKAAGVLAGLGAAVVILNNLATGANKAAPGIERVLEALAGSDFDTAFAGGSKGVEDFAKALELVAGTGFDANIERIGEAIGGPLGLTGVVGEARAGFASLDSALSQLVAGGNGAKAEALFAEIGRKAAEQGIDVEKLKELFPQYADALAGASNAQEDAAGTSDEMAEGLDDVGFSAEDAKAQIDELAETIRGFGSEQLSLNDANRAVEESLDSFTASIEANGATLDITTEAGRQNSAALDDIARKYLEAAAATVEQTGKQEDALPVLEAGRQAFIDAGIEAGLSADEANAYADELGLIPADVQTKITLDAEAALAKAYEMADLINNRIQSKTVYLYVQEQRQVLGYQQQGQTINANGGMYAYANGGFGSGIYAGRPGALYKFAEPETRWEAFVSGKPGQEDRNRAIVWEAGDRLGMWGSGGGGGDSAPVDFSPVIRQLQRLEQTTREVRDRTGTPVPMGAVQGALGSSNVGNFSRGR